MYNDDIDKLTIAGYTSECFPRFFPIFNLAKSFFSWFVDFGKFERFFSCRYDRFNGLENLWKV